MIYFCLLLETKISEKELLRQGKFVKHKYLKNHRKKSVVSPLTCNHLDSVPASTNDI